MKLFFFSLVFLFSLTVSLAQPPWYYYEFDGPRRRSEIEIPLEENQRAIITYNHWRELDANQNVDSLIQLFIHDWNIVKLSGNLPVEYKKILFSVKSDGKRILTPFIFQETNPKYFFKADSSFSPNPPTDTLILEKEIKSDNKWKLPQHIRFYFLLSDFKNIEKYHEWKLKEKIDQARKMADDYEKRDIYKRWFNNRITLDPKARYPVMSGGGYYSEKGKTINFMTGAGIRPNQLYTTISADFLVLPLMSQTGLRFNFEEYFFAKVRSNNSLRIEHNSFVNVGFAFFNPWPKTGSGLPGYSPHQKYSVALGYLVRKGGNAFSNNTWRFSSRINLGGKINIEPEVYWNGVFKNVYPGVRVNFLLLGRGVVGKRQAEVIGR